MNYIIFLISLHTFSAYANDNNCKSIQDSDKKNYCLATETHQKSFCYTISDTDLKNLCMAQLKQQKNYCYKIFSDEVQKQCLKSMKWTLRFVSDFKRRKKNQQFLLLRLYFLTASWGVEPFMHLWLSRRKTKN